MHRNTLCWWPSPSESLTSKAVLFLVNVNACAKFSFRDNKKAGRASVCLKRRWKEPTLCKGDSFSLAEVELTYSLGVQDLGEK